MARTDEPIKKLFKNKENFADLFNATIFHGKQVIKADKLIEINTEDIHIEDKTTEELEITKKYRDLTMLYKDRVLQIVLGCEDQSTVDYSMPIRTMGWGNQSARYDSMVRRRGTSRYSTQL